MAIGIVGFGNPFKFSGFRVYLSGRFRLLDLFAGMRVWMVVGILFSRF